MQNGSDNPTVTVLMPVYNTEKYLKEAIDSILNQSFTDFEFIIIDDASTDNSVAIIQSYTDTRIKLIVKPQNTGYTASLNMGLEIAKGKYIARMDSDDISALNRLEIQVEFMEANMDIAVCGSWYQYINADTIIKLPLLSDEVQIGMLSYCPVGHPTVMLRNAFLAEHGFTYNPAMEPAEDYDLWARISSVGKIENLPLVLLHYRIHENQVSVTRQEKQKRISTLIRSRLIKQVVPSLEDDIASLDFDVVIKNETPFKHYKAYKKLLAACEMLEKENQTKQVFSPVLFTNYMKTQRDYFINRFLSFRNFDRLSFVKHFLLDIKLYYKYVSLKAVLHKVIQKIANRNPKTLLTNCF